MGEPRSIWTLVSVCRSWRLGLAAVLLIAGCDLTGQYDKEFQKALQISARQAVFNQNLYLDPMNVKDAAGSEVGVKLRVWKYFDNSSKALATNDPRAQIPFVSLSGLSYVVERQLDDEGQKFLPAYLYVAKIAKADQKADALQAALLQQAAAAIPTASWSEASLPKPDGTTISLKRLRADGQQVFLDPSNKPAKVDGRLDLYYIDAGSHHVLIGWRAPKAQSQKYQFDSVSEAAMGTLEVSAQPAGGKAAPTGCG